MTDITAGRGIRAPGSGANGIGSGNVRDHDAKTVTLPGEPSGLTVVNGHNGHAVPPVQYSCTDGIAVATLAHPESRNALSAELLDALDAVCAVAVEEGAKALILTANGRTFCSGGDLGGVAAVLDGDVEREVGIQVDRLHDVIATLRALPMPTVAAVNGTAVGAGVALALACDVRVLTRSASFITGYLAVNATPDGGSSYHLARALGGPQALSSLLLNKRFTADELERSGLADRLVDDGEVLPVACELARGLAKLGFGAVRSTRELVDSASSHTLAEHLDAERTHFLRAAQSPEFRDSVAPFARPDVAVARA